MGTPLIHQKLIKAWADGAAIQKRYTNTPEDLTLGISTLKQGESVGWIDVPFPRWGSSETYRIKPEPVSDRSLRRQVEFLKLELEGAREENSEYRKAVRLKVTALRDLLHV